LIFNLREDLFVQEVDAIELKGNPFDCKNECHPKTPNPNALPFLAERCALIKESLPFVLTKNSSNTPSKK
jgi:hypothetical protein